MNNEIGRKITSLTLMTIMIVGGMTYALPGKMMPAAYAQANANLFVSVENSFTPDRFGGAMVVEVVVNDPALKDRDKPTAEPDVTVNGKDLRMVQATDGSWYAYFTDTTVAKSADALSISTLPGTSLDFGKGCNAATAQTAVANAGTFLGTFADTEGVYFDSNNGQADVPGTLSTTCPVPSAAANNNTNNVVREPKTPTNPSGTNLKVGQIGIDANVWPFIQLYSFAFKGDAKIVYNIGGGSPQTVTLVYDNKLDNFAKLSIDRASYPQGADVHMIISDNWLNVDPTDEDSWTFGTNSTNSTTVYQVTDENGQNTKGADSVGGTPNLQGNLTQLNAGTNLLGVVKINYNPNNAGVDSVLDLFDNADQNITQSLAGPARVVVNGGNSTGAPSDVTRNLGQNSAPVTFVETEATSGLFQNTDESDNANIRIATDAPRGTTATVNYNDKSTSIVVANFFGTLNMDESSLGGEWNSGEDLTVLLTDQDTNQNSKVDEDIKLSDPRFTIIPEMKIGTPRTLAGSFANFSNTGALATSGTYFNSTTVDAFSDVQRAVVLVNSAPFGAGTAFINYSYPTAPAEWDAGTTASKFVFLNYDLRSFQTSFGNAPFEIRATNATVLNTGFLAGSVLVATAQTKYQQLIDVTPLASAVGGTDPLQITFNFTLPAGTTLKAGTYPSAVDVFSYGTSGDGNLPTERFNNAIYRFELEETGDNTGQFAGTIQYIMLNQLNVNQTSTYTLGIKPIDNDVQIIVGEDLTDEDSPRINYLDKGADGTFTQIADQQAAPTHSGVVSFGSSTYKVADTVDITLQDQDLNTDVDTIDIFTTVPLITDAAYQTIGAPLYGVNTAGESFGRLLDITFDDALWTNDPANDGKVGTGPLALAGECAPAGDTGLVSTGFSLIETAPSSGIFKGNFIVPPDYCATDAATASTTGVDMAVDYVDFRDASGEIIEVGDGAGIRANTGSVSLDRTVYPVPWGQISDIAAGSTGTIGANKFSIFPIHSTGVTINADAPAGDVKGVVDNPTDTLGNGDVVIHLRVNDPDFDVSATGEDKIAVPDTSIPPVKLTISRGQNSVTLGYAGGTSVCDFPTCFIDVVGKDTVPANDLVAAGLHTNGKTALPAGSDKNIILFGPITEIAPDAGIFEQDVSIRYTDGPADLKCPTTTANATNARNELGSATNCIIQGDILTVQYTDPTDASGDPNTVTDSATFDLRNGVLQSDKSVYIIGADMILTVIEPDWDLNNDGAETYDLDAIEWDSDAATVTMGNAGANLAQFDPEPSSFRETGDSTGIFQAVIQIPESLNGDKLERGEQVKLEYTDWGPSGADFVGKDNEDINLTIFTSNFGATVELDQKVYSWTDKVYITIVAPDHNFDSNLIDEIGNSPEDPIKVATRGNDLNPYKLVETGTDTGIFTGEVILTGFPTHDADADGVVGDASGITSGTGPTDGFLRTSDDDGITVSFEFSQDETVVGSALIRWNIGEVQWLEASYPALGTGVVRVVDPDLNLNPEAVDNFDANVWSDSDAGGITLTVTETNEATGIFEGTVFFTVADDSSGHRLRVAEGDTITAEYKDNTLPDPYTTADQLDITATSIIGTIVPPLERAPASGIRVVDAFGNSLGEISVDQQVQITSDLANGQDRAQAFAYLVQVQDNNGVTVSLAWITGSLTAGQSFSPALSWIPNAPGKYTATAFVWESVDNPTALSPPVKTTVNVI
jgi:hypothetical protein